MKKLVLFFVLAFILNACNLNNPEANRIVGTWIVDGATSSPGNTRNNFFMGFPAKGTDITFTRKETLTSTKEVFFSGGWCNWADRYSVKNDTIFLEYGKPGCIPLIPPKISSKVAILALDRNVLKIRYEGYDISLNRK
ncbi:MAG: hypothetical protein EAZ91_14065 [Cytophagales bacterium]|nr:MAG: hypothetical protein EAZ91_14065 [Cytophagales bacterium]